MSNKIDGNKLFDCVGMAITLMFLIVIAIGCIYLLVLGIIFLVKTTIISFLIILGIIILFVLSILFYNNIEDEE